MRLFTQISSCLFTIFTFSPFFSKMRWITEWIRNFDLQVTSRERNPQFCGNPQQLQERNFYQLNPDGKLTSSILQCSQLLPFLPFAYYLNYNLKYCYLFLLGDFEGKIGIGIRLTTLVFLFFFNYLLECSRFWNTTVTTQLIG